jgi:hypothetical protein
VVSTGNNGMKYGVRTEGIAFLYRWRLRSDRAQ